MRASRVCGLLVTILLIACAAQLAAQEQAAEQPLGQHLEFGLRKVWEIELILSREEYEAMQPQLPGPPGAPPVAPAVPVAPERPVERNDFGTAFPWAKARMTVNGQQLENVELRYAGDITYFVSARNLKRPLAIRIKQRDEQIRVGAASLHLHSMPLDPSRSREALAMARFRAVGVAAPATAFAEVTLTVPGQHEQTYLGLYTVVQGIDGQFLTHRFGNHDGLLMKPGRMRGVDYLGDNWAAYAFQYQPQREATQAEAKRVMEFARLINESSDEQFERQIGEYLDIDAFLRFQAANALTANVQSFFGLGLNYYLYLDHQTNRFVFLPGDLEFSLANFLLMGTADQLMDMSLTKPYPGENKLPDRLLAIDDVAQQYQELLNELARSSFTRQQLVADIQAIAAAIEAPLKKETAAMAARNEDPSGFGGPGVAPQPPELLTFAEKRTDSIAAQLAGNSQGFVPQPFNFGPPGGAQRNNPQAIDEETFQDTVSAPPDFEATLYAAAPQVNYPVAIATTPEGIVFVASDEQGSLGRTPDGGKILRCVDLDGDGKVDEVKEFARVEHPRGLCYRNGTLWVMHPPTLSVFHDDDNDGVADRQEELVTGLTTNQITDRGGDHTTNCVRMGIDGWLYIGVGDYGIKEARGKDGTTLSLRGGGVVRVRPDGTELELYCSGLRNPFDLAIDPLLNIFTRDNTNDGAGWDTRVSHLIQSGEYGYTRLFANFTDEILPPLGTFGGGGGTGGLFIDEPRWPAEYRQALYTGDWGRSEVYRHELTPAGPTFSQQTDVFLTVPRATGMDIDAQGRLYVASWYGGEASVYVGPNVGFVTCIRPKSLEPVRVPDFNAAQVDELIDWLDAPQSIIRLNAQGELLGRGRAPATSQALLAFASDTSRSLKGRVAALWTLKQLDGSQSHPSLVKLAQDESLTEYALRALTDRKSQLAGFDAREFIDALHSDSPRVRAQAAISLGRLGDVSLAAHLLPLTSRPEDSTMPMQAPVQNQPDPDRVIPHLAVRSLVSLNAAATCLEGLDGPHWQGALWAMRYMHSPEAVEGLIKRLNAASTSDDLRRGILFTLIRLYHREAPYDGSWWGIRPDSTGPYYDRQEWEMTSRIAAVLTTAILDSQPDEAVVLKAKLQQHRVALPGISDSETQLAAESDTPIVIAPVDPNNPQQLGNMPFETARRQTLSLRGDIQKGEVLFRAQSCNACHTTADGQTPKGPHLVDIGKRYKPEELIESILKPSAKIAQGYEAYAFVTTNGQVITGFVVSEAADAVVIRESNSVRRQLKHDDIEERVQQQQSVMPEGLAANLTAEQLADLLAYLKSL